MARKEVTTTQLIEKALKGNSVLAVVNDHPSSIEVSKNRDGSYTWSVKAYCRTEDMKTKTIKLVKEVNKELKRAFS